MRRRVFDHFDPYLAPAWRDEPEPSEMEEDRMTASEELRDTIESMYSASVIPRRSVDRIRRALNEDPPRVIESYLREIERGMDQILALYDEALPAVCATCDGTGRATSEKQSSS